MSKSSQNIEETTVEAEIGVDQQSFEIGEIADIQFEEIVDIDAIQKKLQKKINEDNLNEKLPEVAEVTPLELDSESKLEPDELGDVSKEMEAVGKKMASIVAASKAEVDPNAKKYVIYIDSDNIDFTENLSPSERRAIVNKILREQNGVLVKKKELEKTQRFLRHALVATITFIIGFPIMFYCVNKATQATIDNYKQAKADFSRLYKEQGKVKQVGSSAAEKFKY